MSDRHPPVTQTPDQPAATPATREPWTPPVLESLDVIETKAGMGPGGDGGPPGFTAS
jgi:hypothetical protein